MRSDSKAPEGEQYKEKNQFEAFMETSAKTGYNIKELTNNTKYVVNDEECTYCGACRNVCPSKAFIFERKFKDVTK